MFQRFKCLDVEISAADPLNRRRKGEHDQILGRQTGEHFWRRVMFRPDEHEDHHQNHRRNTEERSENERISPSERNSSFVAPRQRSRFTFAFLDDGFSLNSTLWNLHR